MAKGRMISQTIGSSRKFHKLHGLAGELGDFAQALYPLLVVNSDDHGRMDAHPFTIKMRVFPVSPHTEEDFERALEAMQDADLIQVYDDGGGRQCLQITGFYEHQKLARPAPSKYPPPPGYDEEENVDDVEAYVFRELNAGRLTVGDLTFRKIERQVRMGNRYANILAIATDGTKVAFTVRRHKITQAVVAQTVELVGLFGGGIPVVIGTGIAPDAPQGVAVLAVCDEKLRVESIASIMHDDREVGLESAVTPRKQEDARQAPLKQYVAENWQKFRGCSITSATRKLDWIKFADLLRRTKDDPAMTLETLAASFEQFMIDPDPFYRKQGFGYWCDNATKFIPQVEQPSAPAITMPCRKAVENPCPDHTFNWTDCEICQGDGRLHVRTKSPSGNELAIDDPVIPFYKLQDPRKVVELETEYPAADCRILNFRCSCPAGKAKTIPQTWPRWVPIAQRADDAAEWPAAVGGAQ